MTTDRPTMKRYACCLEGGDGYEYVRAFSHDEAAVRFAEQRAEVGGRPERLTVEVSGEMETKTHKVVLVDRTVCKRVYDAVSIDGIQLLDNEE